MPTDDSRSPPQAAVETRPAEPPAASVPRATASVPRATQLPVPPSASVPRATQLPVAPSHTPSPPAAPERPHHLRRWVLLGVGAVVLALVLYIGVPWIILIFNTVSTDDAYVNSYPTFVAPRVAGQVVKVLVVDNQRVKKGDLIVQLDKEPFQIQVDIKKASVKVAETNLTVAQAQVRSQVAQCVPTASSSNTPSKTSRTRSPVCALPWPRIEAN